MAILSRRGFATAAALLSSRMPPFAAAPAATSMSAAVAAFYDRDRAAEEAMTNEDLEREATAANRAFIRLAHIQSRDMEEARLKLDVALDRITRFGVGHAELAVAQSVSRDLHALAAFG